MLKDDLIERYNQTGKLGFYRPNSKEEAMTLIESLCELEESEKLTEKKDNELEIISVQDMIKKMREFFK